MIICPNLFISFFWIHGWLVITCPNVLPSLCLFCHFSVLCLFSFSCLSSVSQSRKVFLCFSAWNVLLLLSCKRWSFCFAFLQLDRYFLPFSTMQTKKIWVPFLNIQLDRSLFYICRARNIEFMHPLCNREVRLSFNICSWFKINYVGRLFDPFRPDLH